MFSTSYNIPIIGPYQADELMKELIEDNINKTTTQAPWECFDNCIIEEKEFLHFYNTEKWYVELRLQHSPLDKILCQ